VDLVPTSREISAAPAVSVVAIITIIIITIIISKW